MIDIFLDVETTGLDSKKQCIWQLSYQIVSGGFVRCEKNLKMSPFFIANADQEALDIGGITKSELLDFPPSRDCYKEFITDLKSFVNPYNRQDKMTMIGYNIRFDEQFLRDWFVRNGDKFFGAYFFFPPVDVMNLAATYLKNVRHNMPNFKLGTVANTLGIEVDESKLHDAMYDVILTKKIYEYFLGKMSLC